MSDEPSLTRFAGRVGTTLRAIIAGVPIVGGGASSVLTDMAFEDLRRRLARLEGTFAWFGERLGLYDSDVRSSLDGFQLLRLRRFLERAT